MVNKINRLIFGIFQIVMVAVITYVYADLKYNKVNSDNPFEIITSIIAYAKYFCIWQAGTLLLGFCALIYNSEK